MGHVPKPESRRSLFPWRFRDNLPSKPQIRDIIRPTLSMNPFRFLLPSVLVSALSFSPATLHADLNAVAKFTVTTDVARPADKVPPLGANGSGGRAIQYAVNNFFDNPGNEPIHWQSMFRTVNVEGKSFEIDGPSTSWYDLWYDGFLSGANVRIYRIVDKDGHSLPPPADPKQHKQDMTNADHVILVGKTHILAAGEEDFPNGGWVVAEPPAGKKANRVYLAADSPDIEPLDYIVVDKAFDTFDMNWVNPRVRALKGPKDRPLWYWNSSSPDVRFSLGPHPGTVPPEMIDAGKTCMKVEAVPGANQISQVRFIGTDIPVENQFYGQLEPGKQYRMEVWLRQDGLADGGKVQFLMTKAEGLESIHQDFTVDGDWKKYTYDFTAPARPAKANHYGPAFSFTGPGTLYMDNARLFRYDKPEDLKAVYVPNRTVLDELMASQPEKGVKGAHRTWLLDRDMTMDSILSLYPSSKIRLNWITTAQGENSDMSLPQLFLFDYETGTTPETRMVPHIVIQHILHDEADWQHFVEYIAAPYDPKTDTPQTKPWAYRRYVHRGGNGTPWTKEFREIIVEFGNETWHNAFFEDFIGFSAYKAIHQGGPEYGLFCTYLINGIKQSPYWAAGDLDKCVHFNLGGNYQGFVDKNGHVAGYVEQAMEKCPQAQYAGHANYVGPKWETNDKPLQEFNDTGMMATLMGYQFFVKPNQDKMEAAHDLLKTKGSNYDILAYEGGPSGYSLDKSNPKIGEASELYGKSLGMAVAALDAWMGSYEQGWTYQNYLGFTQGKTWSSHSMMYDGFRPQLGWLALTMRNRYASGDLMKVDEPSGPEFDMGGATPVSLPLIGTYAMRNGNRWSIFVLSRKLNANVNGQDMGDGYNPVSIQLPFKSASAVTLYRLTGDPRANNITEDKVKIETLPLDAKQLSSSGEWDVNASTGGTAKGMPPGSIYLYVFESAQ
jgi:hypothetical protein